MATASKSSCQASFCPIKLIKRAPRSEAAAGAKRTVGRSDCHLLWPASEYTQIGKFGPEHHAGWFGAWVSWVGDSSTVEQRTLTPSILVRIQVPQPGSRVSGGLFPK